MISQFVTVFILLLESCSSQARSFRISHVEKRQVMQAPYFSQSTYTFTTSCYPGSQIGTVYAYSPDNSFVSYSVDLSTGSPNYVAVNPSTGALIMSTTSPAGGFLIRVIGTSAAAMSSASVQIVCSGTSAYNPYGATSYNPYGTTSNNPYGTTSYNPYATSYNPYATSYNPYGTSYPYSTGTTYPYGTSYPYTNTYGTSSACPSGTAGFSQCSYTFSASSCYPGSSVGSVYAPGATGYAITAGNTGLFAVSQSGQITLATAVSGGTYTLSVSSYGAAFATVPVTVTVLCSNAPYG